MPLILRYAVRSDLGLVRSNNEDSVYAGPRLLAIADGMGGHAAGEVASKIVIGALEGLDADRPPGDLIAALRDSVLDANERLRTAVARDSELDGMGTTLTALRFYGSQVGLVHVGDSRGYLLRGGQLTQITHDDTYVQYLVDQGKLTPDEAKDHPRKSVILRALRGADVEPDVSVREARAGDRYLLCTDGLSDVVSTETIFETMQIPDPQESADRLVELALRGGGPDNVTVIVADVVESRPGDVVDDVPVIAGAFVDPAAADAPGVDSPAERAAGLGRPKAVPVATETDDPARGRRRWRTPLLIVGVLVLIFGGLGGTYVWAQTQYYVGKAGDEVAIYRGVDASFGPIKFSEVNANTDLTLNDLVPSWRSQVQAGITASSKSDAERIVRRLHDQQVPLCLSLTPPARSTITPTPHGAPSTTRTPEDDAEGCDDASDPETDSHPDSDAVPLHAGHAGDEYAERSLQVVMTATMAQLRIPTRRNAELLMLLFSVLIVVCAEAAVEAAHDGHLSTNLATYAAVPIAIGLVTHLVIRRVAPYADPILLPCVVLLNGLGLVMIHRLDLGLQQQAKDNQASFSAAAPSQVLWTVIGVSLFVALIVFIRDHRSLQRYAYTLALVGLVFLMLPAVLPARYSEVNGARIWIRVAGFSIQPGEFAKILLTIFGAAYLVAKRDVLSLAGRRIGFATKHRFIGFDLPRGRDLGPLLAAWLICIGVLVRGRDLGTSLLFFGLFVVLLYVTTERVSWVIIGILMFAVGAYISYQLFGTVQTRVAIWLHLFDTSNPPSDPAHCLNPAYVYCSTGYQMRQSLYGLGTGGIFGTGLGGGHPELVPLPSTDFIMSSFGEETGLFGVVGLLMLYALFVARGLAAGLAVRDSFGKLLATGLSFSIGLQLFVVVAGVTRLLPETGLTTPFLSYGGSSLVTNWVLLALLLRISDAARRPATTPPPPPPRRPLPRRLNRWRCPHEQLDPQGRGRTGRPAGGCLPQPELRAGGQGQRLPQRAGQPARPTE